MRKNPRRILSPQRLPFRHPGNLTKQVAYDRFGDPQDHHFAQLLPNFLSSNREILVRSNIVTLKDRVSQMPRDAPRNERRNSASYHSSNRTASQIMEQQLRQLSGYTGHIPAFSEVPNTFPLLVASGPGENVIVRPLTLRRFLDLFEGRGIQDDLAGLRILGGSLKQVNAFFGEAYLAAQQVLEFFFSKAVAETLWTRFRGRLSLQCYPAAVRTGRLRRSLVAEVIQQGEGTLEGRVRWSDSASSEGGKARAGWWGLWLLLYGVR